MDGIASTPEKKEKYKKQSIPRQMTCRFLSMNCFVFSRLDNNTVPYKFTNVEAGSFLMTA